MNHTKNILFILLMIGFANCSSSQKTPKLQKSVSFNIQSVVAQSWTAGQEQGGSGLNVYITINNLDTEKITLQDFYFKGKKTSLEKGTSNKEQLFTAYYVNVPQKDIIIHNDQKKEAGNEPPKLQTAIPFTLKENEGVISYTENDTLKYYKVVNIEEKLPLYYPNAPNNKQG